MDNRENRENITPCRRRILTGYPEAMTTSVIKSRPVPVAENSLQRIPTSSASNT